MKLSNRLPILAGVAGAFVLVLAGIALGSAGGSCSHSTSISSRVESSPSYADTHHANAHSFVDVGEFPPTWTIEQSSASVGRVIASETLEAMPIVVRRTSLDSAGKVKAEWDEIDQAVYSECVCKVARMQRYGGRDQNPVTLLMDPQSGDPPETDETLSVLKTDGSTRYELCVKKLFYRNGDIASGLEQIGCSCNYEPENDRFFTGQTLTLVRNYRARHGIYRKYSPEGYIGEEGRYDHGLKEGEWRSLTYQGEVMESISYSKSKRHGPCVLNYEDNFLLCHGTYASDKKDGHWDYYYSNGQLGCTGDYREGKRVGRWTTYYMNGGSKLSESDWVNGREEGECIVWYEHGGLQVRGAKKAGSPQGHWTFWRGDGTVLREGGYVDGEGVWTDWSSEAERDCPPQLPAMPVADRDPEMP